MRQYSKPFNDEYWYHISYFAGFKRVEFWCDKQEEYEDKLGFINRHAHYEKLFARTPLTKGEYFGSL